jgi:hypothetical protein
MQTYRNGAFGIAGARTAKAGGNSHAVTFADPMMQLYRLTGDEVYLKFAVGIYESYNREPPRDHDLARMVLDNPGTAFVGHGAHTAEAFHLPFAVALLGNLDAERRAQSALSKLAQHTTPGGALVSDELIEGRLGNGFQCYEYCTQAELIKSLSWIAQYRGSGEAAESAARLFFNAVQGARLHPLAALQYLSCDDRLDLPTNAKKDASTIKDDGSHFQMSSIIRPTCCPASSGRPLPYFLSSTWMRRPDGTALALMNFAPTNVTTMIAGVPVRIVEETSFPFGDRISLSISPEQPLALDLAVRLPPEGGARLRVWPGPNAPAWAKDIGGSPVAILHRELPITVGRFWSKPYRDAWRDFLARLAARYDAEPLIREITNTSGSTMTDESVLLPGDPESGKNLRAAGFTDAQYKACLLESPADYDSWKTTLVESICNPYRALDSGSPKADPDFTLKLMRHWRKTFGARGVLANHALSHPISDHLVFVYDELRHLGPPLAFQTHAPNGLDWAGAIREAVSIKAGSIELWTGTRFGGYETKSLPILQEWASLFRGKPEEAPPAL